MSNRKPSYIKQNAVTLYKLWMQFNVKPINARTHGEWFEQAIYGLAIAFKKGPLATDREKNEFIQEVVHQLSISIDYGELDIEGTIN